TTQRCGYPIAAIRRADLNDCKPAWPEFGSNDFKPMMTATIARHRIARRTGPRLFKAVIGAREPRSRAAPTTIVLRTPAAPGPTVAPPPAARARPGPACVPKPRPDAAEARRQRPSWLAHRYWTPGEPSFRRSCQAH